MFGGRVKDLKSEINFLREENKALRLQLIAMSSKSSEYWNTKLADKKNESKGVEHVIASIDAAPAVTPEQKIKKERAKAAAVRTFAGC